MTNDKRHDDYLWDKSGTPDPTVARLEALLSRFADAPQEPPIGARPVLAPWQRSVLAVAAVLALLVAIVRPFSGSGAGRYAVSGLARVASLGEGEALALQASESAVIAIGKIGDVVLQPGSRLAVDRIARDAHRLALREGSVHATILAPARVFQIDTPAGLTVDLGCEYTLDVDAAGNARLVVLAGQVAFEFDGRDVYVPAGAECESGVGRGPSAPVFLDAAPELRALVRLLEFEPAPDPDAARALVERVERREDCLTLYHLLDAPSPVLRKVSLGRLAEMFAVPEGFSLNDLALGNPDARLAWRETMLPHWRTAFEPSDLQRKFRGPGKLDLFQEKGGERH